MAGNAPEAAKRPRGRPTKSDADRKRSILSMRVRDGMRETLSYRAAENQRSISEEIEAVLESALQSKSALDQALDLNFGRQLSGLILLLARVVREPGFRIGFDSRSERAPRQPLSDPYTFDQIAKAVARTFEALRPPGEILPPKMISELRRAGLDRLADQHENIGEGYAVGILCAVAGDPTSQDWLLQWTAPVRDRLGHDVVHRIAEFVGVNRPDE